MDEKWGLSNCCFDFPVFADETDACVLITLLLC